MPQTMPLLPQRILHPEGYKQRIRRMWNRRGADYDRSDSFHSQLAQQLVKRAVLKPGQTVLDIASGTGMVALEAAGCVGAHGKVTALDILESMLAQVRM